MKLSFTLVYGEFAMATNEEYDIAIIGAGVLGASIAYELSLIFNGKIAILEKENYAGLHSSTRNTGVIHRPFYLDSVKKNIFAKSSQISYEMWKSLSLKFDFPWVEKGTLEIATREEDTKTIDQYYKWAMLNGMSEREIKVLNEEELQKYEPLVRGYGGILSITDTCVNFGMFTEKLIELAKSNNVSFLNNVRVTDLKEFPEGVVINYTGNTGKKTIKAKFLINVSGGDALTLAHKMHIAKKYAVLHFRGDYWVVGEKFPNKIRNNIYTVPKYKKFPFLDPHFILRYDGRRELGPNAALVSTPYEYTDHPHSSSLLLKLVEKPIIPKIKLLTNPEFISLVRNEWKSSRSMDEMAGRVKMFIPSLETSYITGRGMSGVRNSLVDSNGFVSEAVLEQTDHTIHILNYNSPGATGAPAFSLHLLNILQKSGKLSFKKDMMNENSLWSKEINMLESV